MLYTFPYSGRQKKRLPLLINLIGFHHLQEPVIRPRGFELYQLLYCVDGSGEIIAGGRRSVLRPGQLILLLPFEAHSYRALTEEWHVHILCFSGGGCADLLGRLGLGASGIYHMKSAIAFQEHYTRILQIRENFDRDPHNARVELSKLCYALLLDLSLTSRYVGSAEPANENETVKAIVGYLEEHYSERIGLPELADLVHLSPNYISTIFRKEMQQTVTDYLTGIRLLHARLLLKENPELKIAQIAAMCGFESPAYFTRMFRRAVGMTPIRYRLE